MEVENKLPNFICIGSQKSGTTTIYNILKNHNEIFLSEQKELHFFDYDDQYDKGVEYYKNFFKTDKKIVGEITPSYIFFDDCAKRIYTTLGAKIKILIILRNPIDRAFSHYLMSCKRGFEKKSFEEAIILEEERICKGYFEKSHYSYISRGKYSEQIKRYYKYFDKENIKIIFFEEFIQNQQSAISSIENFLNIKSNNINLNLKSNYASNYRFSIIKNILHKENIFISRFKQFLPKKIKRIVRNFLESNIFRTRKNIKQLSLNNKKYIYGVFFKEEIKCLENLLKIDLSFWKYE